MDVRVLQPNDETIARFIKHFYFFKSESKEFRQSYVTFPNLTTPLSLFSSVRFHISDDGRHATCSHDRHASRHAEIAGMFTHPIFVTYNGEIDEIAIVFHPLGLNQFIRHNYCEVAGRISQTFNPYGGEFERLLANIFQLPGAEQRREALESFFLKHYVPFEDYTFSVALTLLTDFKEEMPVAQIASSVGVSHKTLTRMFQRHLGATPVTFRKIARFRRSLELVLCSTEGDSLTKSAHLSNYYDQAHFIKHYHQLTGEPPASFFRHLTMMGGKDILWRLM